MRKKINSQAVLNSQLKSFEPIGKRFNSALMLDEDGFLFCEERPSDEPVAIVKSGNDVFWDIADDYLASGDLYGRPFIHGVFDCFTFLRDYYYQEFDIDIGDYSYEDDWWKLGKNYYLDNLNNLGLSICKPPLQEGDVILMNINSPVPNHAAIYIGDGMVAHHMGERESNIEKFRPAYLAFTTAYCRYVGGQ
jgi:cell wall-associated NlpC family hydrolase